MVIEQVRNATTQESPVRYVVTVRLTSRELESPDYMATIAATIERAIRGIE